ncbi:MAG: hypothetical protein ABEH47_08260 [Haloferacaceae archaeon]
MVVELVLTGVVLAAHTLLAAVMTRFLRIRMNTRWGAVVYTLLLVPVVLTVTTLLFGQLPLVPLGDPATVVAVMVGMPLALGFTIDVLYVPAPEEYDLPDTR